MSPNRYVIGIGKIILKKIPTNSRYSITVPTLRSFAYSPAPMKPRMIPQVKLPKMV